jgi:GNAT superfamily N-acetyltransferase
VDPRYTIAAARPGDCTALGAIERAAAGLLRGYAPESVLRESTDESEFREAQSQGRLWVALEGDNPVGFALVEMLASDLPHLEEVDVHPAHGRRGVGARLVRTVCEWVARSGFPGLTLTTYRDVPWNMPFYARLGFEEVAVGERRRELEAIVRSEAMRGLDPERRLVMRYEVRANQRP